MRWEKGRKSGNVEDRRGQRVSKGVKGGGIGILLLALVGMYFGIDPSVILNLGSQIGTDQTTTTTTDYKPSAEENRLAEFVSVVLADTEDTWKAQFSQKGGTYVEPKLVLFSGSVQSACGFAQSAMGPFYCPGDQKVYIDLSFYQDLKNKMNAPGDFAQAYVIAHEVGHHVQKLLGNQLRRVHSAFDYQPGPDCSGRAQSRSDIRPQGQADCQKPVCIPS